MCNTRSKTPIAMFALSLITATNMSAGDNEPAKKITSAVLAATTIGTIHTPQSSEDRADRDPYRTSPVTLPSPNHRLRQVQRLAPVAPRPS